MFGLKIQNDHSAVQRMNHGGKSRSMKPNLEAVAKIQGRYRWIQFGSSLVAVGEKWSRAECNL